MLFRDKFRLFVVLRAAFSGAFPALTLALLLAGAMVAPPAAASAMLDASPGAHEQAAVGEARLLRADAPAPDRPAACFDRHHPCGPGAIAWAQVVPLSLGLKRCAGFVAPREPEQGPVFDVTPHLNASLTVLFRNFRE